MTGLRRLRRIGKGLIILSFTWEAAVTIVSLVLLITVAIQRGGVPASDLLIPAAGTLGISAVVIGAIWEGRRRKRLRNPERVTTAEEKA